MSDVTTSILWQKGWRINGKGEWFKPTHPEGLSRASEREPNTRNEPMGKSAGENDNPGFRVVRITSYRCTLCDERNLWDKYFTDSLVKAGLLLDDSPQWCRVEVSQVKVDHWKDERTEITVEAV